MGRYVIRRLLQSALLIFVVATLVSVFVHLIPGDPAYVILGDQNVTEEKAEAAAPAKESAPKAETKAAPKKEAAPKTEKSTKDAAPAKAPAKKAAPAKAKK